jgi:hypothetical protein
MVAEAQAEMLDPIARLGGKSVALGHRRGRKT